MADNDERCCTCTTPEYTIKLNKQGPQGLTGPQGEPGFSPVIEVSEETPTSYRLSIQTIDGSYETPNLKANFPLGGYVNQVLVKQSNADGDATWDYIPYATTELTGGLQLATSDDVVSGSTKAITGDILAGVIANFNTTLGNYVDKTSTQTITGAKTFNNYLTVGDGYSVDTDWLNVRNEYISMGGKSVVAREENQPVDGFNHNEYFRIGGSLPLLLYSVSGRIKIWRDSSARIIVDADNIGDYIPDPLTVGTLVGKNYTMDLKVSSSSNPFLTSSSTDGYTRIGSTGSNGHLELRCGNDELTGIVTKRNGNSYINLDSGNISSDPYIASLVSRIEALES